MSRLVTRAEFASLAKVSKAAITKACGAALAPAGEGQRIDIDHPAAVAYLARRGVGVPEPVEDTPAPVRTDRAKTKSTKRKPSRPRAPTAPAPVPTAQEAVDDGAETSDAGSGPVRIVSHDVTDVSAVADMTIRQVVAKWGTVTAFKDWLLSLRMIADVHAQNLKNAQADGKLISRDLVTTRIMGALESSNRRLLTDAPKTIARELYAAARANVPLEEGEQRVRRVIESQLRPAREAASRALRTS